MTQRFEYTILDNKQIEIKVDEKTFTIGKEELIILGRILSDAGFEFCKKFKCRLDDPACK